MLVRSPGLTVSACFRASFLLILLGFSACSAFKDNVRELGRAATQGVGQELPSLKGPLRQTLRDALLGDELLNEAGQRIAGGTLHSLELELQKGTLSQTVDELIAHALATVGDKGTDATRQLIKTAGPELQKALREIVLSTMATAGGALKEAIQKDLTAAMQLLAKSTAEALVATIVKSLEGELGQELKQTAGGLSQQLISEATSKLRDPASKAAVSEFAESALKGAVRGTRDGITESLPSRLQVALISGLVVAGVLLLLISVGFAVLFHRYRQSTKSLTIIAEKINEAEAAGLKQAIQKSATANYVGPWLSTFLKQRGL